MDDFVVLASLLINGTLFGVAFAIVCMATTWLIVLIRTK